MYLTYTERDQAKASRKRMTEIIINWPCACRLDDWNRKEVIWRARCNLIEEVPYTRLYSACTILTITCLHKPGTGTSLNGKNMAHFSFPIGTCLSSIDFLTTVRYPNGPVTGTQVEARVNLPILKNARAGTETQLQTNSAVPILVQQSRLSSSAMLIYITVPREPRHRTRGQTCRGLLSGRIPSRHSPGI